jgi:hypothetical protein
MRRLMTLCCMLIACAVLAACETSTPAQSPDALPTLAQLPVATGPLPTQAVTSTYTTDASTALAAQASSNPADAATQNARATLPATWTASPTRTPIPTITLSPSVTVTPSATITETPTHTPTPLPTIPPESRAITSLLQQAANATVLPTDFKVPSYEGFIAQVTPTPFTSQSGSGADNVIVLPPGNGAAPTSSSNSNCTFLPPGGFGTLFRDNPDIADQIGCPSGSPPDVVQINAAWQRFERGLMIWLSGTIYVLNDVGSRFSEYTDTFDANSDPADISVQVSSSPPSGLQLPVRGFGKIWANNSAVRDSLGFATQGEIGDVATVQRFNNGVMVSFPGRQDILVLIGGNSGSWRAFVGQF